MQRTGGARPAKWKEFSGWKTRRVWMSGGKAIRTCKPVQGTGSYCSGKQHALHHVFKVHKELKVLDGRHRKMTGPCSALFLNTNSEFKKHVQYLLLWRISQEF
eukprot:scaffold69678_cov26-Tisochrysis_lutea.AAC.1